MSEQPKVHVFLGAPSPSSCPDLMSGAGIQNQEHSPADWRVLELIWQEGRLRLPAAEGTSREISDLHQSGLQSQDIEMNTCQKDSVSDRTTKDSQGLKRRAGRSNKEDLGSGDQGSSQSLLNPGEESNQGRDEECPSSVLEYLDSCFPGAQPEIQKPPKLQLPQAAPHMSAQTQYLTTWTLSQALVLRSIQSGTGPPPQTPPKATQTPPSVSSSTPELFSPVPPSPGLSVELFSQSWPTPRMEEGGIVIETTADGLLCTQEDQQGSLVAQPSPSKSPDLKKVRISENLKTEVAPSDAMANNTLRGPTTLLISCDKQGVRYSVLVAVVHPCHLKEVKLKSGLAAGTFIPLASLVVTDQSGMEMKVVLWRRAAFWALTVNPGDVLLIKGIQVNKDRWRGETVLQSTFSSKLLNLGPITSSTSPPVPQSVNRHSLTSLWSYLRDRRPLLVSQNLRPPQDLNRLPYATLGWLRVNTLVHALLRVSHSHTTTEWRSEAESHYRSAVQLKAVLTVEQPNGQQGTLLLWGAALDWLPRFNRDKAAVWDFHSLLVREGLTSDLPELHSTPWSYIQPLDPANRQAQEFFKPRPSRTGSNNKRSLELDLDTLLSQKHSGQVELRVQVTAFHFQNSLPSQNAPQPVLDSSTSLDGILLALGGDITYTGCGRCSTELDTDANGIYCPCYPCLPHTAVRCFYRPGLLTVSGRGSSQVCVQVPPVPLQKILEAPPDKLHRNSAPGSNVKHIQVAAEKIQTVLSLPRKTFIITIQSHFLCDENSIPINQDFMLLDLQFPS